MGEQKTSFVGMTAARNVAPNRCGN